MGREAHSNSVDLDQWPQNVLNTNGLKILKKDWSILLCLSFHKMAFVNSVDSYQTPQIAASDQSTLYAFRRFSIEHDNNKN